MCLAQRVLSWDVFHETFSGVGRVEKTKKPHINRKGKFSLSMPKDTPQMPTEGQRERDFADRPRGGGGIGRGSHKSKQITNGGGISSTAVNC